MRLDGCPLRTRAHARRSSRAPRTSGATNHLPQLPRLAHARLREARRRSAAGTGTGYTNGDGSTSVGSNGVGSTGALSTASAGETNIVDSTIVDTYVCYMYTNTPTPPPSMTTTRTAATATATPTAPAPVDYLGVVYYMYDVASCILAYIRRGPQGASLPPRLCLSYILHPICFYPTRSVPCTDSLRARAVPPARRHAQNVRGLHDME